MSDKKSETETDSTETSHLQPVVLLILICETYVNLSIDFASHAQNCRLTVCTALEISSRNGPDFKLAGYPVPKCPVAGYPARPDTYFDFQPKIWPKIRPITGYQA